MGEILLSRNIEDDYSRVKKELNQIGLKDCLIHLKRWIIPEKRVE